MNLAAPYLFPLFAFLAVLVLVPPVRKLAIRFGYVDKPGGRKDHSKPTPPIGGVLVVPVFIVLSYFSGADIKTQWPFWTGLLIIMAAGVMDDRYAIRPRWKFLAQFTSAALIVYGGANVSGLGNLLGFGPIWLGFMTIPFSLIAAVLLINAINLIDGLDGLAGGKSFVALCWMLIACVIAHSAMSGQSIGVLMGALAAFLIFNMRNPFRSQANIFLGDAGSMALGLSLAWYGMTLARAGTIEPIAVAWILALPIMDTCAQFARRVGQGRHPFDADRNHFHHHFINAGVEVGRATAVITLLGFFLGMIGIGGMILHVPESVLGWLWIATILAHIYLSLRPHRFRRIVSAFRRLSTR